MAKGLRERIPSSDCKVSLVPLGYLRRHSKKFPTRIPGPGFLVGGNLTIDLFMSLLESEPCMNKSVYKSQAPVGYLDLTWTGLISMGLKDIVLPQSRQG